MKQYSPRERFACGLLAVVCLLAGGFWTYFLFTDPGTRGSVSGNETAGLIFTPEVENRRVELVRE
jgi:hypothetical protein